MTCEICSTYDEFIYEELSPKGGWGRLSGQAIYECATCGTFYTLDDIFSDTKFPANWVYWTSKEAAMSHLSWLDSQPTSQPLHAMNEVNPKSVYEIATQLVQDGFSDSNISVSDGVLSVTLLKAFRQYPNGKFVDCCKTAGIAFKNGESYQMSYLVRLHICPHLYQDNGEPDVAAIWTAASNSTAAMYLRPNSYSSFLSCLRKGSELLELELNSAAKRIVDAIENSGCSSGAAQDSDVIPF